ncbi:MAG: hypothetical protein H0T80_07675 [Betaproteobacteria bacterium]|nr:hypothetical protein [Betaproteobacteria bacterium]
MLTNEAGEAEHVRETLRARICDALRGEKPRVVATSLIPGERVRVLFEDGSTREVDVPGNVH